MVTEKRVVDIERLQDLTLKLLEVHHERLEHLQALRIDNHKRLDELQEMVVASRKELAELKAMSERQQRNTESMEMFNRETRRMWILIARKVDWLDEDEVIGQFED